MINGREDANFFAEEFKIIYVDTPTALHRSISKWGGMLSLFWQSRTL